MMLWFPCSPGWMQPSVLCFLQHVAGMCPVLEASWHERSCLIMRTPDSQHHCTLRCPTFPCTGSSVNIAVLLLSSGYPTTCSRKIPFLLWLPVGPTLYQICFSTSPSVASWAAPVCKGCFCMFYTLRPWGKKGNWSLLIELVKDFFFSPWAAGRETERERQKGQIILSGSTDNISFICGQDECT